MLDRSAREKRPVTGRAILAAGRAMNIKRLLVIGLVAALLLRLLPIVAPIVWPGLRRSVAALRRRADLAAAAIMLALVVSMFARQEPVYAAIVAVLSLPAWFAGVRALRG